MKSVIRVPLNTSPEEAQKLRALQAMFAQACNTLAPLVQKTRVWNRVALHHMAYKQLREQFPSMGSQMVCNAIYSVSRHSRMVYQDPASPFNLARLGDRPLPRLSFGDMCPVYFDRHTLSFKEGQLSMYTLDGRMRFQVDLDANAASSFQNKKLREVVLSRSGADSFDLTFEFSEHDEAAVVPVAPVLRAPDVQRLPAYMVVEQAHEGT
jgi:hypothetical protein